jgi:hypothetical protein
VSFCRTFQIDPADVPGRQLSELGAGEWGLPQLTSLLKATASGSAEIAAYEIDLVMPGAEPRYLVVNARKLDYGGGGLAPTEVETAPRRNSGAPRQPSESTHAVVIQLLEGLPGASASPRSCRSTG